ncbi:MAG: NeuD/PglB/VioB family sugar acetyltransferase [Flavobacterium sp.]|nr:NeuD/PglB/VioB family sugar acetyltransferase [Flavobacterium sp.]
MKKLIIIGAGSVGKFIAYNIDSFQDSFSIVGFVDDDATKQGQIIVGFPVLGSLDLLKEYSGKGYAVVVGIAFPKIKNKIIDRFKDLDFEYPNFISNNAWLSREVSVGIGSILYPGVSINYETIVGDFVVMNMNCAIGHNARIADFSSLAPGVNLGGYTSIGKRTDMGIGAATKQFITIGSDCVIGGQAMVVVNIKDNTTVKGIPAK